MSNSQMTDGLGLKSGSEWIFVESNEDGTCTVEIQKNNKRHAVKLSCEQREKIMLFLSETRAQESS